MIFYHEPGYISVCIIYIFCEIVFSKLFVHFILYFFIINKFLFLIKYLIENGYSLNILERGEKILNYKKI